MFFQNQSSALLRRPLCLCGEYTVAMKRTGPNWLTLWQRPFLRDACSEKGKIAEDRFLQNSLAFVKR
jgi:hypothetical protein